MSLKVAITKARQILSEHQSKQDENANKVIVTTKDNVPEDPKGALVIVLASLKHENKSMGNLND